jgi:large subunit ribosomal protein L29
MKKADYSQLALSDLNEKLKDERSALDKMKFTHAISPVESPARITHTRKNIARLLTQIRKQELAAIKK